MICRSLAVLCVLTTFVAALAHAEKRYGPGATNTEILLGQSMPYSGPASIYGTYGKTQLAFFRISTNTRASTGASERVRY